MKLKKVLALLIVLAVVVSGIVTVNLMTPKKTEAFTPVVDIYLLASCCLGYARNCPTDVQDACFADCYGYGDCNHQN